MTAIGIYSLYHVEEQPILAWLDSKREYVKPYVLITSQWQRWNLFSPDPLRRVIQITVTKKVDGNWEHVGTFNRETVGLLRQAAELKTIRRMEDDNLKPLQQAYIADMCRRLHIPAGTTMKMEKQWYVIPKHDTTYPASWWRNWEPEWNNTVMVETTCPQTS